LVEARDEPQRCPREAKRITIQLNIAMYRQLEANDCPKVRTLWLIRAKEEDDDFADFINFEDGLIFWTSRFN
jgi:hypothetical protein